MEPPSGQGFRLSSLKGRRKSIERTLAGEKVIPVSRGAIKPSLPQGGGGPRPRRRPRREPPATTHPVESPFGSSGEKKQQESWGEGGESRRSKERLRANRFLFFGGKRGKKPGAFARVLETRARKESQTSPSHFSTARKKNPTKIPT